MQEVVSDTVTVVVAEGVTLGLAVQLGVSEKEVVKLPVTLALKTGVKAGVTVMVLLVSGPAFPSGVWVNSCWRRSSTVARAPSMMPQWKPPAAHTARGAMSAARMNACTIRFMGSS